MFRTITHATLGILALTCSLSGVGCGDEAPVFLPDSGLIVDDAGDTADDSASDADTPDDTGTEDTGGDTGTEDTGGDTGTEDTGGDTGTEDTGGDTRTEDADRDTGTEDTGGVTCADVDCGAYTCDEATSACRTSCTGETVAVDCVEDAQCDEVDGVGTCNRRVAAPPFLYVAVVSTTTDPDAINNPNPGPDLDYISVSNGGAEFSASAVLSWGQGAEGDDRVNTRPLSTHAGAVTDQDTVVGGLCDLDAHPGFVAIGGTGGFITVQFGTRELSTGDRIIVYEVDSDYCSDVAVRSDSYEVFVTNDAAAATSAEVPSTAGGWCIIGAQMGDGGVGQFWLNLDGCLP